MSHAQRTHGHSPPVSERDRRRHPALNEDEAEEMDVENTQEAEEEDALDKITKGSSKSDIAQRLCLHLEANPEDEEARALAKFYIRKMYIDSGGLPFNTQNPIPFDLDSLSAKELINVLENMLIYTARTKQKELVGKAINTVTNLAAIFGGTNSEKTVNQLQSDEVLRTSLFEVFLGQNFGPLLSLIIVSSSHLTNLVRAYYEKNGKPSQPVQPTQPTGAQSTASSGISSNATNKPSV